MEEERSSKSQHLKTRKKPKFKKKPQPKGNVCSSEVMKEETKIQFEATPQPQHKGESTVSCRVLCLPAAGSEFTVEGASKTNKKQSFNMPKQVCGPTQTPPDAVQVADEHLKFNVVNTDGVSDNNTNNELYLRENLSASILEMASHYQPLPKCYTTADIDDGGSCEIDQCYEVRKNEMDLHQNDYDTKLPFVKKLSSIWEVIDSLVEFRSMEYPHFNELHNVEEGCREGLAIGKMLTFIKMVNEAPMLKLDNDPTNNKIWDSYLTTLLDLERNGFNVKVQRERFKDLLAIKEKHQSNQDELKTYQFRLTENLKEKRINNEEIEKMNKKTRELGEEIDKMNKEMRELEEKLNKLMSGKEDQDSEIDMCKQKVDELRETIRNTQLHFESVVASPMLA